MPNRPKHLRCCNLLCRKLIEPGYDHVVLRTEDDERVRLCMECFDTPLKRLPQVVRAAEESERLFSVYGPL